MSTIKRRKIQKITDQIVKDLDVCHVVPELLSCGVLNEQEFELITSEKTRGARVCHLLDLVQRKGENAIDYFVDSLKTYYKWLYDAFMNSDGDNVNICEIDSGEESSFHDVFLLGGVPPPPPYNVKREQKLTEIRKHLQSLERLNFVVLHGMTGTGKSCLAASSVEDREILLHVLKGCVYWITVGDSASEDILSCMLDLWERLKMNHSNLPPVDGTVILDKTKAKERLKHVFLAEPLREGLLILDDVRSAEFIESFDFGCKIMVTTKDLSVMKSVKGRYHVVEVNGGLREEESLSLLANSVNLNPDQLPEEAKRIHNLCQGYPMILALVAGQLEDNKEDAQASQGRWKHCADLLKIKQRGPIRRQSFFNNDGLFKTISYSIDELRQTLKEHYFDFAVFMEDVNIKPEVLQTLWSFRTKYEAEDIMSIFIKKSLAVKKWNEHFRCSIYGIHDLLLYYLKDQLNPEERIALHKKLLRRYEVVCNGKYAELPNDNYIYSYIGYHLSEAEEWGMFKDLFLDLTFIQSKVKITGPADLLRDFKKYEEQIINGNEELRVKLDDYVQFIQNCGVELYKCHDLDIIQCGLHWKKTSHVYHDAYKLAKENPEKLYLELLTDQDFGSQLPYQIVPMKEEICAACFVDDDTILIAASNAVHLWRLKHYQMLKTYYGHKKKIIRLQMHPDGKSFLSCCEDGTVKLWTSDISNETLHKSASENFKISSPSCLQKNWNSMFLEDTPNDESSRTLSQHNGPVLDAKFSHSGEDIVSCSEDSVIIWKHEKNIIQKLTQNTSTIRCVFSNDDSLVFIGTKDGTLSIHNSATLDFVASFRNLSSIVDIFSVKFEKNKVCVVSQKDLRVWHWEEPDTTMPLVSNIPAHPSPSFAVGEISYYSLAENKENTTYVCATLSAHSILIVAAVNHVISVWDLKKKVLISEHQHYSGLSSCFDTYVLGAIPLLMCGEDRIVKIWHLTQIGSESSLNLKPGFHAVWDSANPSSLPFITTPNSKNALQVLRGGSVIAEEPLEENEILSCTFSSSLTAVFYGCADGHVKKYEIGAKCSKVIMKLDTKVIYLQSFNCGKEVLVAGDEKNLKLWKEDNTVVMCYGQLSPVLRCFLIPKTDQLLACNQDAGVKLWNISSGNLSQVIIGSPKGKEIVCADLSTNCEVLVMCDNSSTIHVASLTLTSSALILTRNSLKDYKTQTEMGCITSCKITPGGQLLALGFENGSIQLWDLQSRQVLKEKLELHTSPVSDLHFAPFVKDFLVLVSTAEKIGWWKINCYSQADIICTNLSHFDPFEQESKSLVTLNMWANKKGNADKPLLLGCVKPVGLHALKIYCNSDFSQFVTIDSSGILYPMKVVDRSP